MAKKSKKTQSKPLAPPAIVRLCQGVTVQVLDRSAVKDLLQESAAAIHAIHDDLRKLTIDGAVEIGRRLRAVREVIDRGQWLKWLKEEFGWSDRTARNFMNIYKLAQTSKLENFSNLSIPRSALYLLAAPRTSDKIRGEVLVRAEAGEKMSVAEVGKAIAASSADNQPSAATDQDQDQAQSVDPEMDAIVAKRAEYTIDSEPRTVAAAGTQRRVNPRGKYIAFLKLMKPGDFRLELLDLCREVAELDRGWAISLEDSPRMILVESPEVKGDGNC